MFFKWLARLYTLQFHFDLRFCDKEWGKAYRARFWRDSYFSALDLIKKSCEAVSYKSCLSRGPNNLRINEQLATLSNFISRFFGTNSLVRKYRQRFWRDEYFKGLDRIHTACENVSLCLFCYVLKHGFQGFTGQIQELQTLEQNGGGTIFSKA